MENLNINQIVILAVFGYFGFSILRTFYRAYRYGDVPERVEVNPLTQMYATKEEAAANGAYGNYVVHN